jgi:hypothetical protein
MPEQVVVCYHLMKLQEVIADVVSDASVNNSAVLVVSSVCNAHSKL